MPRRRNSPDVARRSFLKGASLVGAAALTPVPAKAQVAAPRPNLKAAVPGPRQIAADTMRPSKDLDVGTTLKDPNIDYAAVAKAFGVHGEGPVSDPNELAPALERAMAAVKSGQPALVDVVTDPR